MDIQEIKDHLKFANPDALFADGLDDALIGSGSQWSGNPVAIYSKDKCIEVMAQQFAEDNDIEDPHFEAEEYLGYNTFCAYVGENTPIFMD